VQSRDGGRTWIDRVEQCPYDTHTLATHPKAPKRLYSSAGDGYFESFDYGDSWCRSMDGLKYGYLYGLAVDSGDPQNVIVYQYLQIQSVPTLWNMQSHMCIEEVRMV
jgi:hypothetical protein